MVGSDSRDRSPDMPTDDGFIRKAKENCWEFTRCGRGPGGTQVPSRGLCPVVEADWADGLNGGKNAGRIC